MAIYLTSIVVDLTTGKLWEPFSIESSYIKRYNVVSSRIIQSEISEKEEALDNLYSTESLLSDVQKDLQKQNMMTQAQTALKLLTP